MKRSPTIMEIGLQTDATGVDLVTITNIHTFARIFNQESRIKGNIQLNINELNVIGYELIEM